MPSVARHYDHCSGHHCYPPRQNYEASGNVFVNNRGWHRQGDRYEYHCCDDECHDGALSGGSTTVFINGKPAGRLGDQVNCGSVAIEGSTNVFCGD